MASVLNYAPFSLSPSSSSSSSSSSLGRVSLTRLPTSSLASANLKVGKRFRVRACMFNPNQDRILSEALKEPVAFLGGVFAGLLRLDLNEDPLKEWVTRTVEAAGITEELKIVGDDAQREETPQEIQIE